MHPQQDKYLKYLAAMELGLMDRLHLVGWAGLTAQESGRIGSRVKQMKKRKEP